MVSTSLNQYAYCLSGTNSFHFLVCRVKIPFTKVLSPLWSIPNMKESDDITVLMNPCLPAGVLPWLWALRGIGTCRGKCVSSCCSLIIVYRSATTLVFLLLLSVRVCRVSVVKYTVCVYSSTLHICRHEKMKVL